MAAFVLLVLVVAAFLYFARSNELFAISVQDGKQSVTRGYVPPALLGDFADVLRGVKHAKIRALKSNGRASLEYRGDIDEHVAQRLRNVLGLYPLTRFKLRR